MGQKIASASGATATTGAKRAPGTTPTGAKRKPTTAKPLATGAESRPAARRPPANVRSRATLAPPPPPDAVPADHEPPESGPGTVGTVVQAAAELTEIGLRASARALRGAVSRLPRP